MEKTIIMKTFKIYSLVCLIVLIIALSACGSRKVELKKLDTKTETTTTDQTKTEIKTDTNTKVIDCTEVEQIEYEPIDNTLPITINGKEYKNVRIKAKKAKNNISIDKAEKKAETKQNNVKTQSKAITKVKEKKVETNNYILYIIIFLFLIAIFIYFKKKRDLLKKF
jgi:preprotein translocase subunit SecF